jgi:rfaE bifunctional protein nucleotidyltransferase chain/domain
MARTIVLANGCFDILHYGHLAHLEAAREAGDWLIVALTGDAHVNKGPGRPVFNAEQRAKMLRSLRCVDEVIVSDAPTPHALIDRIRPNIYAKGKEYVGKLPEQSFIEGYGGRVLFTDTVVYSSTKLLGWL